MSFTAKTIYYVTVGIFLMLIGGFIRGCFTPTPEPVVKTEVQYVDRYIQRSDTSGAATPTTRIIYLTQYDTVRICLPAPESFTPYGIIPPNPVRVRGNRFTLTYWQPDSLRFIQDTYKVPPPRWSYGLQVGLDHSRYGTALTGEAAVRFKSLTISGGAKVYPDGWTPYIAFKARLIGKP